MFEWWDWFAEIGAGGCAKCGFAVHPKALDFHHRDPATKLFGIGKFVNGRSCNAENKQIVREEIEKCDVLCANCHRILHFVQTNEHSDSN
jgi:hypothetical protein